MKTIMFVCLVALLFTSSIASAGSTYIRPYIRNNGTMVQGHYRTTPDSSRLNNWSTRGNVNPYTSKQGTVDPYNGVYNSRPSNPLCPYGNCSTQNNDYGSEDE